MKSIMYSVLLMAGLVASQGGGGGGLPDRVTTPPQVRTSQANTIYKLNFTSTQEPHLMDQNHLQILGDIAFTAGPLPLTNVSWLGVTAIHTTTPDGAPSPSWSLVSIEIQVRKCPAPLCRNSTDLEFWLDLDFNQRLAAHGINSGSWSVRSPPASGEPPIVVTLAPGQSLNTGGPGSLGGPDGGPDGPDGQPQGDGPGPSTGGATDPQPDAQRPPKPHLRVQAQITTTLSLEEAQTETKREEIRQDIADACNVPVDNVTITSIRAGSVIVEFEIETTNYDNDTEVLSQLMNATQTGDMAAYTTSNQTVTILVTVIVNQTPTPVIIVERENTTAIALVVSVGLLLVVVIIIASVVMVISIKKASSKRGSRTKRVIVTPVEELEGDEDYDSGINADQNPIAAASAPTVQQESKSGPAQQQQLNNSSASSQQQQQILLMQQMMMMQQQAQLQAQMQQQQQQITPISHHGGGKSPAYYGMSSSSGSASGSNANMTSFGSSGLPSSGNQ